MTAGPNDVEVKVGADSSELDQGMRAAAAEVSNSVRKMQRELSDSMTGMQRSISSTTSFLKGFFSSFIGVASITQVARSVVQTTSNFESLEIQLRAVMGSAEKGDEAFAWIKQFAIDTPYSVESTTKAFLQLKNFGLDPMDGTLRKVADASAKYGSDAQAAERVTLALGQAWARGKLQGQDILQMINAGIPVYDLLSSATGKNAAQLQKMSEAGTITRDLMRQLVDEMGKSAEGTAEARMHSLAGAISNMGDAYANAIDDVRRQGGFQFLTDSILSSTEAIPDVVEVFVTAGRTISTVVSALWNTVAEAFSEIRSAIMTVFGIESEPMTAMQMFRNTLKVIEIALIGFRVGFDTVFTSLKVTIGQVENAFMTFGEVADRVLQFDWAGAKAAYTKGFDDAKLAAQQGADDLIAIARKGREDMDRVLLGQTAQAAKPKAVIPDTPQKPLADTGMTDEEKKLAEEQITAAHKKAIALIEIDRNAIAEKRKLRQIDAAEEARLREELAARAYQVDREELTAKIKLHDADKLEKQKLMNQLALLEVKHKTEVLKIRGELAVESARIDQQSAEQIAEHTARLSQIEVDGKRQTLALQRDLGMISRREELAELRRLAEEEYQIERRLLEQKLDLYRLDAEAKANIQRQIVELQAKHAQDMRKIDGDILRDQSQVWVSLGDRIGGLWDKGLQAMMNGTLTWRNAVRAVFADLTAWFAQEVIGKKVKAWITGEILQSQATAAGVATRTSTEAAGAAASTSISAGAAFKNIMVQAWEAMAGAYKAIAAIPYVGPFMAPVVAAGAFAAVAGLARNVFSAEGGFDIPAGANPLVQAHQKEMILPQKYADVIRGLSEGGAPAQGGDIKVYVSAIDAKGVRDFFKKNSHSLAPAMRNMVRNFTPVKA